MRIKAGKTDFLNFFYTKDTFTTDDLYSYYLQKEPGIKKTTVNLRVNELVGNGVIHRISRGKFTLNAKTQYSYSSSKKQKSLSSHIMNNFPLVKFCIWDSAVLKEFYLHMVKGSYLIVEVERDAVDSVFHLIRNTNRETFKEPLGSILHEYIVEMKNVIIVKALISEAPLQKNSDISTPTLEKILVDLVADSYIFSFVQGNELINIYRNAFEKYTINRDRLKRYAKRRNKDKEINKIIHQITNNV